MSDLEPTDDELLSELLIEWEDCQQTPCSKTAHEICGSRPDLVQELQRRIAALANINRLLFVNRAQTDPLASGREPAPGITACPKLEGYEILNEVGHGGMGVVFKARQVSLNRFVAIKTILGGRWVTARMIARFRIEAETLARLRHPGIVGIYDIVEQDGVLCLVLEFINGKSLAETSRQATTSPQQAAGLAREIATTLAAVHTQEILHRDIKPGNILIDADGSVKVSDFGLAKILVTDSRNTLTGDVIGTPSYMAPEQAMGDQARISEQTDVYSIGATLYELLTARPPFAAATIAETLIQVKTQEPVPPRQLVRSIPRDLETICLKCLEKDPAQRYASAVRLGDDLDRFLRGVPIAARPVSGIERALRWCRRNPDRAAMGGLTIAAVLALTIGMTWFSARMAGAKEKADLQDKALKAETARAKTQEFHARYGRIRERSLSHERGWLQSNLTEIRDAAKLVTDQHERQLLRTEFLRCATSHDVRLVSTILPDADTSCLAHHPQRPILAAADNAAGDFTVTIHLIDTRTLKKLEPVTFSIPTKQGDLDGCRSLTFTPAGDKLLLGSRKGWVYVWDTSTWKQLDAWPAHDKWVRGMAISPDGQTLFTGSETSEIKRWRLSDHALLQDLQAGLGEIDGFCLVRDRLVVAAETGAFLNARDLKREPLPTEWTSYVDCVVAASGGNGLLLGHGEEHRVTQITLDPPRAIRQYTDPRLRAAHESEVRSLAVSQSGRFLVSVESGKAKVWDLISGTLISSVHIPGNNSVVAEFVPGQNRFALAGNRRVDLYEIDCADEWRAYPHQPESLIDARVSDDGKVLAQLGERQLTDDSIRGKLQLLNLESGSVREGIISAGESDEIALTPNGGVILATDERNPCLLSMRDTPLIEDHILQSRPHPRLLTLDTSGNSVYFVAEGLPGPETSKPPSELFTCQVDGGRDRVVWSNYGSQVKYRRSKILAVCASREWIVTSALDGHLRIHNPATGIFAQPIPVSPPVSSLCLKRDGTLVAAGDSAGRILFYRVPEGELLRPAQEAHRDEISGLALGEQGLLVTACRAGEIRLWKLNSDTYAMELLATLGPFNGPIKRLALTSNGSILSWFVEKETAARLLKLDDFRARLRVLQLDW